MNKSATIRKLGAILQSKKATKEEVNVAYENSNLMPCKEDGWISLEEQKPPKSGSYLITTKNGVVCTAHWYGDKFSSPAGKNAEYWMPLPEAPQ